MVHPTSGTNDMLGLVVDYAALDMVHVKVAAAAAAFRSTERIRVEFACVLQHVSILSLYVRCQR